MKHLKTSLKELRDLFENTITVRKIAEPLVSFDGEHPAESARRFMEKRHFDVMGVREDGEVAGYVWREDLTGDEVRDHLIDFKGAVVPDSAPLVSVIQSLRNNDAVFVSVFDKVSGIVTRGDLQKAPVRMWLFGLISLVEMQMLRLIRSRYPDDSWCVLLNEKRIIAAQKILADREKHNLETDLSDCLQWCDKRDIILKDEALLLLSGLEDRKAGERFLRNLEGLRNDLAHAQDIVKGRWPALADLVIEAEAFLQRLEKATAHP